MLSNAEILSFLFKNNFCQSIELLIFFNILIRNILIKLIVKKKYIKHRIFYNVLCNYTTFINFYCITAIIFNTYNHSGS